MEMIEKIDELLIAELEALSESGLDYKAYDESLKNVERLVKLRNEVLEQNRKERETDGKLEAELKRLENEGKINWKRIFEDGIDKAGVACILGMILKYEKFEIIKTKAFTFIPKLLKFRA